MTDLWPWIELVLEGIGTVSVFALLRGRVPRRRPRKQRSVQEDPIERWARERAERRAQEAREWDLEFKRAAHRPQGTMYPWYCDCPAHREMARRDPTGLSWDY